MKKYIGFAALLLMLLLNLPTTNAQAISSADEENIIYKNLEQETALAHFSVQSSYLDAAVFKAYTDANEKGLKTIKFTSEKDSAGIDNSQGAANFRHDFLLDNFWERYNEHITIVTVMVVMVGIYAMYNFRQRRKQYRLLKASEIVLRNITNNINGGVLVFNPQREYQISYVNDGYLKLIDYTKDEIYSVSSRRYLDFIHPDDAAELIKLIKSESLWKKQDNDFSIHLRIKKKDETFVPTLAKASVVINNQGEKELFCVIMDISREQAMMDELEFDQQRHKILLEKSDEILFEINYAEQTVQVSQKFKEKFGWSLPKKYWGDKEPDLVNVYEEDRPEFTKALTEIYGGKIEGELITRVCKEDGTPCWCKIIYHVMKIDDKNMRLIGKITDIDEEMKEKQALLKKAQMDALTGLYNKDAFRELCVEYLKEHHNVNNAIVFFDVDNFKDINDSLGHPVGDRALRDVSQKMRLIFSARDIMGRFGGDEFCVLVKDISEEALQRTLTALLNELRLEYGSRFLKVSVSVSIGAVCTGEFGNDFEKLLEYADKAQYYAKETGKDGYAIYHNELRLKGYEGRKPE